MKTIAIVDDRHTDRRTLRRHVAHYLPAGWTCADFPPLQSVNEYPLWLRKNGIAALIIDERLAEQAGEEGHVNYHGHDVVRPLRQALPNLPIFVVTSYPGDDDLQSAFGDVEGVISRDEFAQRASAYTDRVVRSARRFADEFQSQIAELSAISLRVAQGAATPVDLERATVLQVALGANLLPPETVNRAAAISRLEESLSRAAIVLERARALLEGKNN